jgi:class 3 adenylate cyclase/Tfp pilus assembly protein PilF/TolB-like protein
VLPVAIEGELPGATRERQVVLLIDLVESVRLMALCEAQTVRRWCDLVDWVQAHLLRLGSGRLVKSLGDGLLLVFDSPVVAWRVACALHERLAMTQWSVAPEQRLWLRAGLHEDWLYRHALDVFGTAPNLAARLGSLAGAGETVCSVEVWTQLQALPDIEGEDLGLCWLKHLERPVRVFRLHMRQPWRVESPRAAPSPPDEQPLRPLVALVADRWIVPDGDGALLADLVLHGLTERLARWPDLRVIDALSSGLAGLGLKEPCADLSQLKSDVLKADVLLTLKGQVRSGRLTLEVEWVCTEPTADHFTVVCQYPLDDVFQPDSELMGHVADQVVRHLLRRQGQRCAHVPLHNLSSHALMLAGIEAQHGDSRERFVRARAFFEALVDRHPRLPTPRTWLSQWHVLSITRGLRPLSPALAQEASFQVRQALMHQPDHAQAWAAQAFVQCHLERDPERAHASVLEALRLAPSQALAWTYRTTIESLLGRTAEAYAAGQRALEVAPLGPLRYYQCCLAGHAALFDGRASEAVTLLETSLALNANHSPTLRMLVVAYHDIGQLASARQALRALRRLEPELTVASYLARSPGGHVHRARFADVMAAVGLPRT